MLTITGKALFKIYRSLGSTKLLPIRKGPLKGIRWNVSIPDSRYLLGAYEPELVKVVQREVEQGRRFVDIGANAGYFSLLAALSGSGEIRHIAVEPFPENVRLLKQHLQANGISTVEVNQLAIAQQAGEIAFSDSGNLAANTYKTESSMFKGNTITVKAVDLDSFAKGQKLDENCFIKIDVEGAELDVLLGGENYLKKFRPTILLATHDCHVPDVKAKCLELIQSWGYRFNKVEDEKITGQEDFICYA